MAEQQINSQIQTNNEELTNTITLHDIIRMVIANWYWFVLSTVCCLCAAYYYLASTPKIYSRTATILVKDSRKGGDPKVSYVAKLFSKAPDAALKKVGEEATEVVMAAKDGDRDHLIYETADLWFHSMVVLSQAGIRPEEVLQELALREGTSGLVEKANRKES